MPIDQPSLLFPGDEAAMRKLYQRLVAKWHPDRNEDPSATLIFVRVRQLYEAAIALAAHHRGLCSGVEEFRASDGRLFRLRYLRRHPIELGEMFIAERHVAWVISSLHNIACYLEYAGLSHNAISADTYFVSPVAHSGTVGASCSASA